MAVVFLPALTQAALAQSQWLDVPAVNRPPTRTGATLVPYGDDLMLFGGAVTNPNATEYVFDGIGWQPLTTPVPRRDRPAVAAGPNGILMVHGGIGVGGVQLSDTWTLEFGSWVQRTTPTVPVLADPSLAWDDGGGTFVLVGRPSFGTMQSFRFVGGDWQVISGSPLPVGTARLCSDSVRGDLLATADVSGSSELYRLDGDDWVLLESLSDVQPYWPTLDAERGRVVLLAATSTNVLTTKEWDGESVQAIASGQAQGASLLMSVCHHAHRHETIGAFSFGPRVELRRYSPSPVPMATSYGAPCVDPTLRLALAAGDSPRPGALHRLEVTGAPLSPAALVLTDIGLSHASSGALSLPAPIQLGSLGCLLRVDPLLFTFLGTNLPALQVMQFANDPSLMGLRYDAQVILADGSGVRDTSNGLEVQLGLPRVEQALVEDFASAVSRDDLASGDLWGGGVARATLLGGDGRHGSFRPEDGQALGNDTFVWNTDSQVIPASQTLNGLEMLVTDGRFYFTDFVVPAGVTVRFVGSAPVQMHVRGRALVDGRVEANGKDHPSVLALSGRVVSAFNARGAAGQVVLGQLGSEGGPGGGQGGAGGKKCENNGPEVVGGVFVNNGQEGEAVRLRAGHAYAAAAHGTGGQGGVMSPAAGVVSTLPPSTLIGSIGYPHCSSGGSGGGFWNSGTAPTRIAFATAPQPVLFEPDAAASPVFPLGYPASPPANYSSLVHYSIGGSGGGGGGSHTFLSMNAQPDKWMAGHGGTGGGGAVALRAGGGVWVGAFGALQARGGDGVLITGEDPATTMLLPQAWGASSPGGGGSGGSLLVQSAAWISIAGELDVRGGWASHNEQFGYSGFNTSQAGRGGLGSNGFIRLESVGSVGFGGTSTGPFIHGLNSGVLTDRDDCTGSRSKWSLLPSTELPVFVRYELLVDTDGNGWVDMLLSDDPALGPPATDPISPVQLRLQGARLDPATGQPLAGSIGPWRKTAAPGVDSVNRDHARLVRFDLTMNRGLYPDVQVHELRIVWR